MKLKYNNYEGTVVVHLSRGRENNACDSGGIQLSLASLSRSP